MALENGSFADDVIKDEAEAQKLGIRGVPFFVFNRKYGVSGAQDVNTFLKTLNTSYADWQNENVEKVLKMNEGNVCTPNGDCI